MMPLARCTQRRLKQTETLTGGSVQVWGRSMYYQASGVAEDGPTLLFLHESGGSSATWHGQLVGMAQSARCLVPDLPGHGRSERNGCATVAEYRQAIIGYLDALAIRWPVVVVGVCFGAAVAVDLATHAPERVAGLVLCGVREGGRATDQILDATACGEAPPDFVAGLFSESASTRLVSERMQRWRNTCPLVRHLTLSALSAYPLSDGLRNATQPQLLIAAENDPLVPTEQIYQLAETAAAAQVAVVPGAGCLAMMEQPVVFNRLLGEFVSELRPDCLVQLERRPGGYRRRSI